VSVSRERERDSCGIPYRERESRRARGREASEGGRGERCIVSEVLGQTPKSYNSPKSFASEGESGERERGERGRVVKSVAEYTLCNHSLNAMSAQFKKALCRVALL
jgi:hypothetical protein